MTVGDVELRRYGRPIDLGAYQILVDRRLDILKESDCRRTYTLQIELLDNGVEEFGVIRWHLWLKLPDHMSKG